MSEHAWDEDLVTPDPDAERHRAILEDPESPTEAFIDAAMELLLSETIGGVPRWREVWESRQRRELVAVTLGAVLDNLGAKRPSLSWLRHNIGRLGGQARLLPPAPLDPRVIGLLGLVAAADIDAPESIDGTSEALNRVLARMPDGEFEVRNARLAVVIDSIGWLWEPLLDHEEAQAVLAEIIAADDEFSPVEVGNALIHLDNALELTNEVLNVLAALGADIQRLNLAALLIPELIEIDADTDIKEATAYVAAVPADRLAAAVRFAEASTPAKFVLAAATAEEDVLDAALELWQSHAPGDEVDPVEFLTELGLM